MRFKATNGCSTDMAARRAESIRNMIHGRVVGTEIGSIPISMNLGVAGVESGGS
jgi:hypothetical protein